MTMPCVHDGRLDPAYDFERDPGAGHATCRETPHVSQIPGSDSHPNPSKDVPPYISTRLKGIDCLTSNFAQCYVLSFWMLHSANNERPSYRHRVDLASPLPALIRGGGGVVGVHLKRQIYRLDPRRWFGVHQNRNMDVGCGEWIKKGKEKSSAWREWLLAAMGIPSDGTGGGGKGDGSVAALRVARGPVSAAPRRPSSTAATDWPATVAV
jgi:hypothetical protein